MDERKGGREGGEGCLEIKKIGYIILFRSGGEKERKGEGGGLSRNEEDWVYYLV